MANTKVSGHMVAVASDKFTGRTNVTGASTPDMVNMVVTYNGTNQVDIDATALNVEDYRLLNVNLTADLTVSGANGLDAGSEAVSTWYSVWVIFNPTTFTSASLVSASMTSPTMPAGYTKKRRVGFCYNDGGSNLDEFYQFNDYYEWCRATTPLSTVSTSPTTVAHDAADTPPVECLVDIAGYATGTAANSWYMASMASTVVNTRGNTCAVVYNGSYDVIRGRIRQNSSRQFKIQAEGAGVSGAAYCASGFVVPEL